MQSRLIAVSVLGALIFSSSLASAATRTFKIADEKKRDLVRFDSDAPLELIQGNTSSITGSITIDESTDLTKSPAATFDVDLAAIDTGIPLRNEHMRDNFLHTAKFPKATFVLKKFINAPTVMTPGKKFSVQAEGTFSLHGKTVTKKIPIDLTYFKKCASTEDKREGCDLIQIKAVFPVAFKDHGIERPTAVFQKLADQVVVTVSATAYNQVGPTSSKETGAKPAESKTAGKPAK